MDSGFLVLSSYMEVGPCHAMLALCLKRYMKASITELYFTS